MNELNIFDVEYILGSVLVLCLEVPPVTKNQKYQYIINHYRKINPAINEWYETHCLKMSNNNKIKKWKEILKQKTFIRVELSYYLQDYRKDTHNYIEFISDCLEKITGINDKRFLFSEIQLNIDKENPRIVIRMYELETSVDENIRKEK